MRKQVLWELDLENDFTLKHQPGLLYQRKTTWSQQEKSEKKPGKTKVQ
ncbi:MAG: hypothetical protein ACLSH1_06735 [Clostridia bacterium]